MRLAAAALLLTAAMPAAAAPMVFATRSAFKSAAGPVVTERLSGCAPATAAFTAPLSAATDIGVCGVGAILPGVTFVDDPGPDGLAMYLAGPGYAANATTALGQNNPASDAINLMFDTPVSAIGFNIFQNFGGGVPLSESELYQVRLFDTGGALIVTYDVAVPDQGGAFFGYVTDGAGVAKVSVNNPLAFDLIDNVSFSSADPAPAPASLLLFGLGAAALGIGRRR